MDWGKGMIVLMDVRLIAQRKVGMLSLPKILRMFAVQSNIRRSDPSKVFFYIYFWNKGLFILHAL